VVPDTHVRDCFSRRLANSRSGSQSDDGWLIPRHDSYGHGHSHAMRAQLSEHRQSSPSSSAYVSPQGNPNGCDMYGAEYDGNPFRQSLKRNASKFPHEFNEFDEFELSLAESLERPSRSRRTSRQRDVEDEKELFGSVVTGTGLSSGGSAWSSLSTPFRRSSRRNESGDGLFGTQTPLALDNAPAWEEVSLYGL